MKINIFIHNKAFKQISTIIFVLLLNLNNCCIYSQKVIAGNNGKLWHNIPRTLKYQPDGEDFVIMNGDKRFNRALYGTNTGFRIETGDLPEFALYMPGMGGNLKFGLIQGDKSKWLTDAGNIAARYRPGSMLYEISDTLLGEGLIYISVIAMSEAEGVILRFATNNLPADCRLFWAFGGATGRRFSREGDIGADPESVFYLKPEYCKGNEYFIKDNLFKLYYGSGRVQSEDELYENNYRLTPEEIEAMRLKNKKKLNGLFPAGSSIQICDAGKQHSPLSMLNSIQSETPAVAGVLNFISEDVFYLSIWNPDTRNTIDYTDLHSLFGKAEAARKTLAERIKILTPDPYINTIGGTLSVAADAIWEEPSYLHGAVAWRMRLPGWRGAYAADWLGWHDRARIHFDAYLKSQYTSPDSGPNVPDPKTNLARQEEIAGNSLFTSGYISRSPGQISKPHHYDMNLVFFDQLLWHLKWTGDIAYAREIWSALKLHLAWEKRCFDGDNDGLYDAYACIWASDALQYSGGGVTHSSAYNYRANMLAVEIAELIGEDSEPYRIEAHKIRQAVNALLWLPEKGWYAEYKDLLGLKQVHPSAGLWTVYHVIDSELPDAFRSIQTLRYVDTHIPHIPVKGGDLPDGEFHILSTTSWMPYTWSINNVALAENLHTSLAYWQGGRKEDAYLLWKGSLIESMYMGTSPGNFQQLSFYDAFRGELYRDFADPTGIAARTLVEGLFGIKPDALNKVLTICPGLPDMWDFASLHTPDIDFNYKREGNTDIYAIRQTFPKEMKLHVRVEARHESIKSLTINGKAAKWRAVEESVGSPWIEMLADFSEEYRIVIKWKGAPPEKAKLPCSYANNQLLNINFKKATVLNLADPQGILNKPEILKKSFNTGFKSLTGDKTFFISLKQGDFEWWEPVYIELQNPLETVYNYHQEKNSLEFRIVNNTQETVDARYIINPGLYSYMGEIKLNPGSASAELSIPFENLIPGSNLLHIESDDDVFEQTVINWNIDAKEEIIYAAVDISGLFNDKITNIFTPQYLTPRSPYPTLQIPLQGIGDWCTYNAGANIDDYGLRKLAGRENMIQIPQGIPFATPGGLNDSNVIFTSLWDNYPAMVTIPLSGKASRAYFLMAGSTNPMQSRFVNAKIAIFYTDGTSELLELKNPENWWPVEQDFYEDGYAFSTGASRPLRLHLKTGETTLESYDVRARNKTNLIDGGAATILDIPLNSFKELKELRLTTKANEVIIGLMAVTLARIME